MRVQRFVPLAALGLALVAVAIILASSSGGGERVTAVFQQAYGLVDGGEATIAGIPVGSIDKIALGSDGLPHVTMQLDGGVRLHEGVRADLRELSNSGELNRYVLLEDPGRGPELPDGAEIPSTQTAEPVEIDQVLNTLDPPTRAAVRSVLGGLDSATVGLAPAFRAALQHSADAFDETAGMLQEVTYDRSALRTMVSSGAAVSGALANARPALAATVDQLSALLSETAARQGALGETIARLPAGLRQPGRALDRLRVALPTLRS
ncbi:MAG: phospholipid/cholesterol/gamma-HCH transport system substrate-binding protein, partial [Chloroflexota bacterium]|nr:phospholipid/cholesterol/gamma-HCH transport system substrate-binding protein [Chloroflexota bacterium]